MLPHKLLHCLAPFFIKSQHFLAFTQKNGLGLILMCGILEAKHYSRLSINHENKEEKAELFKTLSVQAIDEMFIMVTIVCTTIEMFF